MKLQPTKDKGSIGGQPKPKPLESIGAGGNNAWEVIARHSTPGNAGNRRRNFAVAYLGATPPRDGPFADAAQAIAGLLPPKTRVRRKAGDIWPPVTGRRS